MKRCRLKRYNFQIRNDMSKEKQTSDSQQNGNDFIADVMSSALTENEIKIAKIQSAMKKLGYQWQEHQFNDGFDEVYIEITNEKDPCAIDKGREQAGWGRMGRLTVWKKALEWAIQHCS
jgi:hypothetical protein